MDDAQPSSDQPTDDPQSEISSQAPPMAAPYGPRWMTLVVILKRVAPIVIPIILIALVWHEIGKLDIQTVRAKLQSADPLSLTFAALASLAAIGVMGLYDAVAFPRGSKDLRFGARWALGAVVFGWTNFITLGPFGGPTIRTLAYHRFGLSPPQITRGFVGHYIGMGSGLVAWVLAVAVPLPEFAGDPVARAILALLLAPGVSHVAGKVVVSIVQRHHLGSELGDLPLLPLGVVSFFDWGFTILAFHLTAQALDVHLTLVESARTVLAGHVAGIVSMVPAGLGAADAVWLKLLTMLGTAHNESAAVIVLFRAVFYLLPWIASFIILYTVLAGASQRVRLWQRRVVAGAVALDALLLLASAATPPIRERLHALERVVPIGAIETSHAVAVASAVVMLFLVRGLLRGYRSALLITAALLGASAIAHPLKGGDFEEAIASVVLLAALLGVRGAFTKRGRIPIGWELTVAIAVASLAFVLIVGVAALPSLPRHPSLAQALTEHAHAARLIRAGALVAIIALAFIVRQAVRPVTLRLEPSPEDITRAVTLIRAHARDPISLNVLCADKGVFRHGDDALALIQRVRDNLIVFSDPVLTDFAQASDFLAALHEHANHEDLDLAFYQISADWIPHLHDFGHHFFKLGEEAVIPLSGFSLEGKNYSGARRIIRKTEEAGITFEVIEPPHTSETLHAVRTVSDQWLVAKRAREMQFSLGYLHRDYLSQCPIAIARDASGEIVAFLNVLALRPGAPVTFDFMRYRHGVVDNIIDYCIHRTCLWAAAKGYSELNLGMAPLADVGARKTSRLSERAAALVYRHAERVYNYQGIRAYKTKFHPEWRPRYLAYQSPWQAPETILLTTLLIRAVGPADRARIRAAHDAF